MSPEAHRLEADQRWVDGRDFVSFAIEQLEEDPDFLPATVFEEILDEGTPEQQLGLLKLAQELALEMREVYGEIVAYGPLHPDSTSYYLQDGEIRGKLTTIDDIRRFLSNVHLTDVWEWHLDHFERPDELYGDMFLVAAPTEPQTGPEALTEDQYFKESELFDRMGKLFWDDKPNWSDEQSGKYERLADTIDDVVEGLTDEELIPFTHMLERYFEIEIDGDGAVAAVFWMRRADEVREDGIYAKLGGRSDLSIHLKKWAGLESWRGDILRDEFYEKLYYQLEALCGGDDDFGSEVADALMEMLSDEEERRTPRHRSRWVA